MSSAINRRFLDVSLTVLGVVNEPPASPAPVNGTQYIVGSSPAQTWTGATANAIARYDGYAKAWKFTKPALGQMEALNSATKQILAWSGTAWDVVADLNSEGGGSSAIAKHVKAIVTSGTALPQTAEEGAKFLNTEDRKLYTATAENVWNAGVGLANGDRYVSVTDKKIYEFADNALTGTACVDGVIFLSVEDNVVVGYDAASGKLVVVGAGDVPNVNPGQVVVIEKPSTSGGATKPVKGLVTSGAALPQTAEKGAKFLNTADRKLYTATAENTWDAGVALADGDRYLSVNDKKIYELNGTTLDSAKPDDGAIFVSVADNVVVGYDAAEDKLVVVGNVDAPTVQPGQDIVIPNKGFTHTENHTLTEAEATAKSFELAYDVVSKKENNVLLIVCGMPQVAGEDYEISGNVVSWADKGLDGIGMETGDVFIVTYPTLG